MDNTTSDWIEKVKARGGARILRFLVDVLEPFGALGAQLLYWAQPASGLIGWRETLGNLADALEASDVPSAMADIRRQLEDDTPSQTPHDGEGV